MLGPNGSGKTSLLKTILGQQQLDRGQRRDSTGEPAAARRAGEIGYIPQQKLIDRGTPVRARDLVALGVERPPLGSARRDSRRRRRSTSYSTPSAPAATPTMPIGEPVRRRAAAGPRRAGARRRPGAAAVRRAAALARPAAPARGERADRRANAGSTAPRWSSSPTTSTRFWAWSTACCTWPAGDSGSDRRTRCCARDVLTDAVRHAGRGDPHRRSRDRRRDPRSGDHDPHDHVDASLGADSDRHLVTARRPLVADLQLRQLRRTARARARTRSSPVRCSASWAA